MTRRALVLGGILAIAALHAALYIAHERPEWSIADFAILHGFTLAEQLRYLVILDHLCGVALGLRGDAHFGSPPSW